MTIPKPTRVNSQAAIRAARKPFCEKCGRQASGEPHHIRSRGAGGSDIPENLIQLCAGCHIEAQEYRIKPAALIEIVARRERKPMEEIYAAIGWTAPEVLPAVVRKEEPSLEELIQAFITLQEQEADCQWAKGEILAALLDRQVKPSWIASQVGVSAAQVRELVKVYRAFPEPGMRVPQLSWYHHRVAANFSDPAGWIARAADEQMSTRQLREAILENEAQDAIREIAELEEVRERREAEEALRAVKDVLRRGGDSAAWLTQQLRLLLSPAA